jgi:DNA modification methylase
LRDRLLHSLTCPNHSDNQRGFRTCGKPSERITKPSDEYDAARCKGDFFGKGNNDRNQGLQGERLNGRPNAEYVTLGWSDCGHDDWRPGLVLDPFAGSGTTLAVATGHGRDAIGIDLDARNADLARERCGMFLTIHETPATIDIPTGDHL